MENLIKVGIADYKITSDPHGLVTLGLGSCVGIAIYNTLTKIGGLSHIMLPDSRAFGSDARKEKFADLAIIMMIREMNHGMLLNKNLVAKIAGGAKMFDYKDKKQMPEIGQRNVDAVEKILLELGIPILGKHTGGTIGRTMVVDLSDFKVDIKTANKSLIIL